MTYHDLALAQSLGLTPPPLGLLRDLDEALGPISREACAELNWAWAELLTRPHELQHGATFSIVGRTWRFETFQGSDNS